MVVLRFVCIVDWIGGESFSQRRSRRLRGVDPSNDEEYAKDISEGEIIVSVDSEVPPDGMSSSFQEVTGNSTGEEPCAAICCSENEKMVGNVDVASTSIDGYIFPSNEEIEKFKTTLLEATEGWEVEPLFRLQSALARFVLDRLLEKNRRNLLVVCPTFYSSSSHGLEFVHLSLGFVC